MIKCRICKKDKEISEFYENCIPCKNKCKQCYADEYQIRKTTSLVKWKEKNYTKIQEYKKDHYKKNKDTILQKQQERYKSLPKDKKRAQTIKGQLATKKRMEDPDYRREENRKRREHRQKNIEEVKRKRNLYLKNKYKNNPEYRLGILLRTSFYKAIKRKEGKKQKSILLIVGCNKQFLKNYLEKQFKPEMNWSNHGEIWEIDHIIPISSFDLTSLEEQIKCFHYTNLQPLFKTTDIARSLGYENEIGNLNKHKN